MFHQLKYTSTTHPEELIILGLCPLFLVVESAIQGAATGLLVSVTLFAILLVIGGIRKFIIFELHILFMLIVSAGIVSIMMLLVASQFYGLYLSIGIYFPLLALNVFIFTQIEEIYFREHLLVSIKQGFIVSVLIIVVFSVFGLVRELFTDATLLRQFDFALGIIKPDSGFVLIENASGIAIFESGAGVLLILAMLIACMNFIASEPESNATAS